MKRSIVSECFKYIIPTIQETNHTSVSQDNRLTKITTTEVMILLSATQIRLVGKVLAHLQRKTLAAYQRLVGHQ